MCELRLVHRLAPTHGSEGAVLISESEWASIEETLYLLRSPKNAERRLEAVRGFEAGQAKGIDFP
ncbi:MAG: type II toxin-antitoxin system Phd/YefM family antitoxin [Alphaproteobacteria bacterium]|nr:MAG: type II toxin-antitoxin system Phd/YefM family antitoxin [Alphaproteobacteria bacterium]